jgi:Tfp pilus assembly protein PilF
VIDPSEDELLSYYEKNITRYDQPEEIRASHILVGDEETAEDLLARLKDGADFAELAREYSEWPSAENGGDLEWFSRGEMTADFGEEFEESAFALDVGEISDVVETESGYQIIKLTDRKAAHTPTLEETRDQVLEDYQGEIGNERFDAWYEEVSGQAQGKVNLPTVDAFIKYQEDIDSGLEAFESLENEGYVEDPYVPYYIGRIYEEKLETARAEKKTLEEKEEKTEEEVARIDELSQQMDTYKAEAIENYLEIVRAQADEEIPADDEFFQRFLALAPETAVAQYLYGKLLEERGDLVSAEMQFQQAIQNDPGYTAAYIASGDVAAKMNAFRRAVSQYQAALDLEPGNVTVLLKIAEAHLKLEEYEEMAGVLSEVRQLAPESLRLLELEGDLAYAKMQTAISVRDALEEKESLSEEEEAQLEEALQEIQATYSQAVEAYSQGLNRSGSVDLYIKIGKTYLANGNLAQAQDAFEDALVRSPYKADAYQGVGDILLAGGDIDGAVEKYKTAFDRSFDANQKRVLGETLVELVPDDMQMRFKLAKVYADQYLWSSVIRQYEIILEHDPASLEAHLGIAEAYKWRTEYDNALHYLNLALTLTTRPVVKVDIYNTIVEIDQSRVGINEPLTETGLEALFELATLYMDMGETELAKEQLEQIQKDDPAYRAEEVTQLLARIVPAEETAEDLSEGGVVQTPSSGL